MKFPLLVLLLAAFATFAWGISSCGVISSPGTYTLTSDITGSQGIEWCIQIQSSNVALDCQGHLINTSYSFSGSHPGIDIEVSPGSNIDIENCRLGNNYGNGAGIDDAFTSAGTHNGLAIYNTNTSGFSGTGINLGKPINNSEILVSNIDAATFPAIYSTTIAYDVFGSPILFNGGSGILINNTLINLTGLSSTPAIRIENLNDFNISNSYISVNNTDSAYGLAEDILCLTNVANAQITSNIFIANDQGGTAIDALWASGCNDFTSLDNNLTGDEWFGDSGSNNAYNNSTVGNIYYASDGTPSWNIFNIATDSPPGWATAGSSLPFGAANTPYYWFGNGQDWHPWTEDNSITFTVTKHVSNTYYGNATANEFTIHVLQNGTDVDGSPQAGSETGTNYTLILGSTYQVTEEMPYDQIGNYSISYSGGCDSGGFITLSAGDNTCTIINSDHDLSFYDACVSNYTQIGANRSYLERFVQCNMGTLFNNSDLGGLILGLIVGGFFITFLLFQNTRIEAKIVVIIPLLVLVSIWAGWIIYLLGLVLGLIFFWGISRVIQR